MYVSKVSPILGEFLGDAWKLETPYSFTMYTYMFPSDPICLTDR